MTKGLLSLLLTTLVMAGQWQISHQQTTAALPVTTVTAPNQTDAATNQTSRLTDEVAGWMIDVISKRGIKLDVAWYVRFMGRLDELENRLNSVNNSVIYNKAETPNVLVAVNNSKEQLADKVRELQELYANVTIPAEDTHVTFATGEGPVTYRASSTDPIPLNNPDVNTGHYDPGTSTFTAPRDGLYLFLMRTFMTPVYNIDIRRNAVEVLSNAFNEGTYQYYDIKLRAVIRFLTSGDTVALYSAGGSGQVTIGQGLFFTGMLLHGNSTLMPDHLNIWPAIP